MGGIESVGLAMTPYRLYRVGQRKPFICIKRETHSNRNPIDLHPLMNPDIFSSSTDKTALVVFDGVWYKNKEEEDGVVVEGDGGKRTAILPPLLARGIPGPHIV